MRFRSRVHLAIAITSASIGLVAIAPAGATSSGPSDRIFARALEEARRASNAQSISAAVVEDGRLRTGTAGIAGKNTGRRATQSTPYAAASVTKMLVATVAMQLVDEGVLSLDEPVSRWLPELPGADQITLRQLLGHKSGLTETPFQPDQRHEWTPDEVLERAAAPACAPGTCFRYSDNGYVAVGRVIESATGQPIAKALRARVLKPLGLKHTWLQGFERRRGTVAPTPTPGSSSLFDDPDGNVPSTEFVTRVGASGALATTAHDLATFTDALFLHDLVSADALATMTDVASSESLPCPEVDRCESSYGLGIAVGMLNRRKIEGHSGSTGSFIAFFPEQRVTIAVVTNGAADPLAAAAALTRAIPSVAPAALTKAEFVEQADEICIRTSLRFEAELPEPVGGAKPVGLGRFMREWVAELRTLTPPADVAEDWHTALDLLVKASHKLDDAENGDPDAQSEALWSLEAKAQEHFEAMHLPFKVCFVE
jgi:D-alanyl-D-alanine carboxypeptidase